MGLGFSDNFYFDVFGLCIFKVVRAVLWFLRYVGIEFEEYFEEEEEVVYSQQEYADVGVLPVSEMGIERVGFLQAGLQGVTCTICLRDFGRDDEILKLRNCCHVFHRGCLDGWIYLRHLTCPLCRTSLLPCEAE